MFKSISVTLAACSRCDRRGDPGPDTTNSPPNPNVEFAGFVRPMPAIEGVCVDIVLPIEFRKKPMVTIKSIAKARRIDVGRRGAATIVKGLSKK
jgi:hypothetical protein